MLQKITFFLLLPIFSYAQMWQTKASYPSTAEERNHPVTFALDGKGYVVTGNVPGFEATNDMLRYDPLLDAWETLDTFLGGARGYAYGVEHENKGYLGFGSVFSFITFEETFYNDLWRYDPDSAKWTELASCPCVGRDHPAMVQVGGKIYVGLGGGEQGDLNDFWVYDIATDVWSALPTEWPSTRRHHPYYFGIDTAVYVGFGHQGSNIYNDFYKYDPTDSTWTRLEDFPDQGRVAGTQFSHNGKGYVLSGQGEDHGNMDKGEFWEYDPALDEWTELEAHPGGSRWAPGSFVIDDMLYFTAGRDDAFTDKKDLMAFPLGINVSTKKEPAMAQPNLDVFPNPTAEKFQIYADFEIKKVELYTADGSFLKELSLNDLNLATFPTGMYLIRVYGKDKLAISYIFKNKFE